MTRMLGIAISTDALQYVKFAIVTRFVCSDSLDGNITIVSMMLEISVFNRT